MTILRLVNCFSLNSPELWGTKDLIKTKRCFLFCRVLVSSGIYMGHFPSDEVVINPGRSLPYSTGMVCSMTQCSLCRPFGFLGFATRYGNPLLLEPMDSGWLPPCWIQTGSAEISRSSAGIQLESFRPSWRTMQRCWDDVTMWPELSLGMSAKRIGSKATTWIKNSNVNVGKAIINKPFGNGNHTI